MTSLRLDVQQGHPLVLVAALPAANHLGVAHVRQQLLLSLMELFRGVVAIHGEQVVAQPVHPREWGGGRGSAQALFHLTLVPAPLPQARDPLGHHRASPVTIKAWQRGHSPLLLLHVHHL